MINTALFNDMMVKMNTILFVYNAKTGFWNKTLDLAHKIISPSSYTCGLCAITHGNFSEKEDWKKFKNDFPGDFVFLYKDQFEELYAAEGMKYKFPVILKKENNNIYKLIDADQINRLDSAKELIELIKQDLY